MDNSILLPEIYTLMIIIQFELLLLLLLLLFIFYFYFFQPEIEKIFFELLLPNKKPIAVRTIYRPPNQSNFLEIINTHFGKLDTNSNKIYILRNFNINLTLTFYLNNSYIFRKNNLIQSQSILSDIKKYYELYTTFGLKNN